MQPIIDIQNTISSDSVPSKEKLEVWVKETLLCSDINYNQPEMTLRIVSPEESQRLNNDYRQKDSPTNVLSFPFEKPEMLPLEAIGELLGDLVICEQILIAEAKIQNKPIESHWAHMIVHGVLHLLGYDHQIVNDAHQMESLEIKVLENQGFSNPY